MNRKIDLHAIALIDEIPPLATEYDEEGFYILPSEDDVCLAVLDYILKHKDDYRLKQAYELYERDREKFYDISEMIVKATFKEVLKGYKAMTVYNVYQARPTKLFLIAPWDEISVIAVAMCKPPKRRIGRPTRKVDIEELRKLKDEGLTIRKIAEKTGIPKTTVHRLLSRPKT